MTVVFSSYIYTIHSTPGASKRFQHEYKPSKGTDEATTLLFSCIFMLVYTTTMSSPTSPLRVAILECDTPIGRTKEKYGGYGNLFKELLHNGVNEVREKDGVEVPELDVRKYDVVNEELYPSLEDVDAVLLSGSREFYVLLWI